MVPYYGVQGPRRETGEMSGKARRGLVGLVCAVESSTNCVLY